MVGRTINVALSGASGSIAYVLLSRIAAGEMFGPDTRVRLSLLDIPAGLQAAEGVALELQDSAFDLLDDVELSDDPKRAFESAQVVLLLGAKPRSKGMKRRDLLSANASIFGPQGAALAEVADDSVRVVVVGNPANTNALLTSRGAAGVIPPDRFSALSRLDQNRAIGQLAKKLRVLPRQICDVAIWGNHSQTQFPDIQRARVGGVSAMELLRQRIGDEQQVYKWLDDVFIPAVAHRGSEIIQLRGASSAASAAAAVIDHVHDSVLGTGANTVSAAVYSSGLYGIPDDLYCSVPVTSDGWGYQAVPDWPIDERTRRYLDASIEELLEERSAVAALGL